MYDSNEALRLLSTCCSVPTLDYYLQKSVNRLLYGSRAALTGTGEELLLEQCLLPHPSGLKQAGVMHTQLVTLLDVMHSIYILYSACSHKPFALLGLSAVMYIKT